MILKPQPINHLPWSSVTKAALTAFVVLCSLSGCNYQKHYSENDYSFYSKNFSLDTLSSLRTDGVYILQKIWTDKQGTRAPVSPKEIYKFYPSGQVNLIVDIDHVFDQQSDYVAAFNNKIKESKEKNSATLFESYYRLENDRIVIQRMSTPRKQFVYSYGLLKKDTLIIVKTSHLGKGKIKDEYFTDYYKAYYTFVQTKSNYTKPNW
ncbi:hypothetical protein [Pedobacter metabolipauper]|uniref:Uncharacterized protein n=1 Tax=Pedobacter metabolipauper TaxID=425513 RepID=A0A4R6SSX6_9SPHI|nr:hypothetical protein [Pedobacter metabolipauper]TDQ08407.1 hypothetical protein ATK78_2920 [Pedobacter metabolipauper]